MIKLTGLDELEKRLEENIVKFNVGRDKLPKKAVEYGYREALRIYSGGYTDGNELPTVAMKTRGRGDWYLEIKGRDLAYLEYGTGVVGATYPHPMRGDWIYDKNGHGSRGWIYRDKVTGKTRWSRGIRGRRGAYLASFRIRHGLAIALGEYRW